jgi:TolB protein
MKKPVRHFSTSAACALALALTAAQDPPASQQQPPPPSQPTEINLAIVGDVGAPPHYAVPDFIPLTLDKETADAARLIAEVLWADLAFEREFDMIPRDTYKTIEQIPSPDTIAFDRWRELGADAVVKGSVRRTGNTYQVEMRLFNVRARGVALGRVYENVSLRNPRAAAHAISDDIHQTQTGLRGVARTKLTFISDRDNERVVDTVETRTGKEVYVADYDGANQMRVTANRRLNVTPSWSPDGRTIAYSSYTRIHPQIILSNVYQGTREILTDEKTSAFMPVYSPDGSRIAFMSQRDGNSEIYAMNRNGSGVRRLTNHLAADVTPTWSPTGTQIAFTSDRSGSPQIWVMDGEGLNLRRLTLSESWADRATWSPAPYNEIAYAGRSGPGFDIKIYDVASGRTSVLTDGSGSNESPAFSPSGRHLAFSSSRLGKVHIFTIARDGKGLRQITRAGNNTTPNWSR